jgi:myo-inositol-1(or 4)-monophosphatase
MAIARRAALAGAQTALSWQQRRGELVVSEKAASDDLVSQADRDAELEIRKVLLEARPDDAILGEEGGASEGSSDIVWAVDPIDGTTNYLYGRSDWAVSVAAIDVHGGDILAGVVVEPALGFVSDAALGCGAWRGDQRLRCSDCTDLGRALVEVNFGRPEQRADAGCVTDALIGETRDVRRGGSAAAALAQVASGRAEAYWGPGLQPWDAAAGLLLVAESGGTVGDLDGPTGTAWPDSGDVLATAPGLWAPLRGLLADALGLAAAPSYCGDAASARR